jgi:hypothetical protein
MRVNQAICGGAMRRVLILPAKLLPPRIPRLTKAMVLAPVMERCSEQTVLRRPGTWPCGTWAHGTSGYRAAFAVSLLDRTSRTVAAVSDGWKTSAKACLPITSGN